MGKVLIIKGADFSVNAVGQIVPPTSGHNYIQFTSILASSRSVRACYNGTIEVGKEVGFTKSSMWTKYKMAVAISGEFPNAEVQWDTQYNGQSYITNNVTILTEATQIMVAPIDGSNLTDEQLTEINNNAFYID